MMSSGLTSRANPLPAATAQASLPTVMHLQGVPPAITAETRPFWEATARGELIVEQCPACRLHVFPPRGICRRCLNRDMTWVSLHPPGILRSYTINHNAWLQDAEAVYGVGLVEFPQYSGVRFVGFLHGFDAEPQIDAEVGFGFVPARTGISRPYFFPRSGS